MSDQTDYLQVYLDRLMKYPKHKWLYIGTKKSVPNKNPAEIIERMCEVLKMMGIQYVTAGYSNKIMLT